MNTKVQHEKIQHKNCVFVHFFFRYAFRLVFPFIDWYSLLRKSFCVLIIFATLYCTSSSDINVITYLLPSKISVFLCWFALFFEFPFPINPMIPILCSLFHISQVNYGSKPICFSSAFSVIFSQVPFCLLSIILWLHM